MVFLNNWKGFSSMSWIVNITDGTGNKTGREFESEQMLFGRSDDCDVFLDHNHISKEHFRLKLLEGKCVLIDLGSTNGTFLNGEKLKKPRVLKSDDVVVAGNYTLTIERKLGLSKEEDPSLKTEEEPTDGPKPPMVDYNEVLKTIHNRLIDYLDLRRLDLDLFTEEELKEKTKEATLRIIQKMRQDNEITGRFTDNQILIDILNEALGLGPLEEFLADEKISEIMVNSSQQIFLEKDGKIILSEKQFSSDKAVLGVIERIVAPIGRRIDESSPMVDARLKDGSRINAIIPPLAIKGPCLTIRKFGKRVVSVDELVRWGTLSPQMAAFLRMCVRYSKNIIIAGGTGSGKTTTLNILSSFIPSDDRIITIEDAAELQLQQPHVVSLEARPPNIEGKGAVFIRDLVKNSLRMRPDRLVIGECRGGETLDMLQAMNTGHDGSLTTAHANSPRDVLSRLETMCLMSGMDMPVRALREQISSAIQIIVHQQRLADGKRKITSIYEVTGMEEDIISMQPIFEFKQSGYDREGMVQGNYVPSGFIPKFYDNLKRRGLEVDLSIFRNEEFFE